MSNPLLLCVHRNRLIRQCLAKTLATDSAGSSDEWLEAVEVEPALADERLANIEGQSHIALIDLSLPESAAVRLTSLCIAREVRVILLSPDIEPGGEPFSTLVQCIAAGAQGYVLEDASVSELQLAIQTIKRGEFYCASAIFAELMGHLVKLSAGSIREPYAEPRKLTERELQILHWIAEGYSNKQVAKKLALSIYTVKNHVHRILNKLNASDRTHAVRHALEANWLPLSDTLAQERRFE